MQARCREFDSLQVHYVIPYLHYVMSDDETKDLAKQALLRAAQNAAKRKALPPIPRCEPRPAYVEAEFAEKPSANSEDALDRKAFRKGGFSKAEKRAYAQKMFSENLIQPPKEPPPAWLNDPSLLPKKPPPKRTE